MTTIENQRALDPIIDGLVKRLRSINCTNADLKHTLERIVNETSPGDEPEPYVQVCGGQGTEHATVRCKNFQVQAENAAKGCCCGSQDTVREIGDAIRKEVTAGSIKLPDTDITEALTDEQIAAVKKYRGENIIVKSVPLSDKAQKAIERGLELGPDAADSDVQIYGGKGTEHATTDSEERNEDQ